jgi:deltex-like protein
VELQKLLDQSFNSGVVTKLERIMPSTGRHYAPPVTSVTPIMSNAAASANTGAQRTAAPLPVTALPTHQPPNSWFQPGAFPTNSSASANFLAQQPGASLALANVSIHTNKPPSVLALQAPPAPRPFRPHSPIFGGTSSQVAYFPTAPPVFGGTSSQVASFPMSRQTFRTPPFVVVVAAAPPRQSISHEVLMYEAPATLTTSTPSDALEACATSPGSDDECPICMEALNTSGQLVKITACGHKYHLECIKAALNVGSKCPICRKAIKNPQGHSPSGTMTITSTTSFSRRCSGFEDHWTIVIEYVIPSGYQMAYHPSPGHPFRGGMRKAYLPNNEDGRRLLERLKLAWMLGLTFTIGTSLTSGRSNVVTWASIHHKTSTFGGSHAHGFPDPAYFFNCNEELDSLGVPKPVQF